MQYMSLKHPSLRALPFPLSHPCISVSATFAKWRTRPSILQTDSTRLPSMPWLVWLQFFLILLLYTVLPCTVHACPTDVCICKWKGGKQTVECGGQQLPSIPEGMDPGTQVLNFSGNSLQVLQSERFLRMDLLNLQKIYLSRNRLRHIHEKAFRGLTNLVELDLSDNALQHVPSETFQDYSSLMRLSLSGNDIRELKSSAFRHLSFLTTLEISNCQIERVENEAFIGMDNLEWLRLDGNRITFIQGTHVLPKSLHGISLQSNRWTCDCRLLDLHAWLVNYNTPQLEEPRCVEPPRLRNQIIKVLKRDDLACLPEVEPKSRYTDISEGRNISIMCVVRAIPAPSVMWLFNGQVLANDTLLDNVQHMFYYVEESSVGGAEEKRSEIFIYSVGIEDNGTFSCVGQNIAGTTFSNYTLRVIIKEPPVVKEVSFPRDYMKYIIASSSGAVVIFAVMLCTVVIKCRRSGPIKRKKAAGGQGGTVNHSSEDSNSNETALMKCSSITNDDCGSNSGVGSGGGLLEGHNSLSGLLFHGENGGNVTPSKLAKENGIIIGGQIKQNLMMYAPAHFQQHLLQDGSTMAQSMHMSTGYVGGGDGGSNGGTPPPPQLLFGPVSYCSPPTSLRNFQEKNPDLINDAESVKNKLKSACSESDYDAGSDCSAPCSLQTVPHTTESNYDSCYRLTASQFGAQMLRSNSTANGTLNPAASRLAAITTLPRGMQLKTVMKNMSPLGPTPAALTVANAGGQHQVDVHLNPVCFLGQDSYVCDYSGYEHLQTPQQPTAHHHLKLHQQFSLASAGAVGLGPQAVAQQNFYRTLPHNRAHKQQYTAVSNTGLRYSLEAEFLQRSAPVTGSPNDKYFPNVRFTVEGYPVHTLVSTGTSDLVQYPSPPEGYKSSLDTPLIAASMAPDLRKSNCQQWPPCLPGYHAQPMRYTAGLMNMPTSSTITINNNNNNIAHQYLTASMQSQIATVTTTEETTGIINTQTQTPYTSCHTLVSNNLGAACSETISNVNSSNISAVTIPTETKGFASQIDESTIPQCDKNVAAQVTASAATVAVDTTNDDVDTRLEGKEGVTKLRHLSGSFADSPDEGYVGESHEGTGI